MKNSVNGKTFDETFDQRGKKLKIGRFTVGTIYLYEFFRDRSKMCIFRYDEKTDMGTAISFCCLVLYSPENSVYKTDQILVGKFNHGSFFKATPDQIALLNSYKQ